MSGPPMDVSTTHDAAPLYLHSSLQLSPNSSATIASSMPIQLSLAGYAPLTIYSSTPISLTAPSTRALQLQPNEPLGPAFAEGWRKLPDEVKIRILAFNLNVGDKTGGRAILPGQCENILFPYLRMGPDIARLAPEVFYKENIFQLKPLQRLDEEGIFLVRSLRLPNLAIMNCMRHLCLTSVLSSTYWAFLKRLAEGYYHFPSLRTLQLKLRWVYIEEPVVEAAWDAFWSNGDKRLTFDCKGSIEFSRPITQSLLVNMAWYAREDAVRQAITFSKGPIET